MKCPNCGVDPSEVTSARCNCPQMFPIVGIGTATPWPNMTCAICGGYGMEHNAYIHNLDERIKVLEKAS